MIDGRIKRENYKKTKFEVHEQIARKSGVKNM